MSDTSRRTDALLRCLWSRKNESSFLGARTPSFSLSISLFLSPCFALLSSPQRDVAQRGATAVSISLFAGIVIKEGLGEFLSPRRATPSSLLRSSSDKTPGRWTDSPFESFPSSLSCILRASLQLLRSSALFSLSFASFYPTSPQQRSPLTHPALLFILCATLHHRSCAPIIPYLLFLISSHAFPTLCIPIVRVFIRFLISLSFLSTSSLRQTAPKIPSGRPTSESPLERAFEKKRIFARSARDEKTPK